MEVLKPLATAPAPSQSNPTKAAGTEEKVMEQFRKVQEMIKSTAKDFAEKHLRLSQSD
jgi:hypothetical protein